MSGKTFALDFAIKSLVQHERITYYTETEGGQWLSAYQNCVPSHAHSFRTNLGREWDSINGWRVIAEKSLIQPDDPRHPVNSEESYYKIPCAMLSMLPEQMQKDFHIIRERVEEMRSEAKEARMFAEHVQARIKAECVTISDQRLNYILRDAYGKFKRSQ